MLNRDPEIDRQGWALLRHGDLADLILAGCVRHCGGVLAAGDLSPGPDWTAAGLTATAWANINPELRVKDFTDSLNYPAILRLMARAEVAPHRARPHLEAETGAGVDVLMEDVLRAALREHLGARFEWAADDDHRAGPPSLRSELPHTGTCVLPLRALRGEAVHEGRALLRLDDPAAAALRRQLGLPDPGPGVRADQKALLGWWAQTCGEDAAAVLSAFEEQARGASATRDLTLSAGTSLIDACVQAGFEQSRGAARRLIQGGGVRLNGQVLREDMSLNPDSTGAGILSRGKRDAVQLVFDSQEKS